jgi:hypothetical protein
MYGDVVDIEPGLDAIWEAYLHAGISMRGFPGTGWDRLSLRILIHRGYLWCCAPLRGTDYRPWLRARKRQLQARETTLSCHDAWLSHP